MKTKKYLIIAAAVAGGVFFFAFFYLNEPLPKAEAAGTIIDYFQITGPTDYIFTGLTKLGENFWVTDGFWREYTTEGEKNHVYEITYVVGEGGSIVSSFAAPEEKDCLKGIANASLGPGMDYFYLCARSTESGAGEILRVTTAGSVVSSFDARLYGGGLAWDGTYLYNVDYMERNIYKYNATGSIIAPFPVNAPDKNSKDRVPYGIAYDGQYLWVTCYGKYDRIVKMTTTGSIVGGGIPVPNTPHPFPTAITADGAYLWYIDDAKDTFYKIDK